MKSGLEGPYGLTMDGIESAVKRPLAGVFALGHEDFEGRFRITRVGRSDSDLRFTLRQFIGTSGFFKFSPTRTAHEAFLKECELFHRFRPPGNLAHPERPAGTTWTCPHCGGSRHHP